MNNWFYQVMKLCFLKIKKSLFYELERLRSEGLSRRELEDAKKYLLGSYAIELQTNGSKAMRMALNELYGLGFDYHAEYIDKIKRISIGDVKRTVNKIINLDGYVMTTIGPSN